MKKTKTIRLSTRILLVLTILITVISLYNIIGFISSMSSETFNLDLDENESTGDWTLTLNANPKNKGFLDVSLFIELTILDSNNQTIATESKHVQIKAGGSETFSVALNIPAEFAPGGDIQNAKGTFRMVMSIRTLGDLIGLTQVMEIKGGET
ncbi:MAG: hypothetical protein ACUVQ8_08015 [Nitrososphaeria archaeon]